MHAVPAVWYACVSGLCAGNLAFLSIKLYFLFIVLLCYCRCWGPDGPISCCRQQQTFPACSVSWQPARSS